MISGSIALLCSRFFSPFPHGTGSLSVSCEYLALRDGPRCFSQDFSCPAILRCRLIDNRSCRVRDYHPLRFLFPSDSSNLIIYVLGDPTTPILPKQNRFGLFRVRSPLLTESLLFSFPPAIEMFQFTGFAPRLTWYLRKQVGCPIRISAGQSVFATNRSFSQLITSFFACKSLGILHVPFSPFFFSYFIRTFFVLRSFYT